MPSQKYLTPDAAYRDAMAEALTELGWSDETPRTPLGVACDKMVDELVDLGWAEMFGVRIPGPEAPHLDQDGVDEVVEVMKKHLDNIERFEDLYLEDKTWQEQTITWLELKIDSLLTGDFFRANVYLSPASKLLESIEQIDGDPEAKLKYLVTVPRALDEWRETLEAEAKEGRGPTTAQAKALGQALQHQSFVENLGDRKYPGLREAAEIANAALSEVGEYLANDYESTQGRPDSATFRRGLAQHFRIPQITEDDLETLYAAAMRQLEADQRAIAEACDEILGPQPARPTVTGNSGSRGRAEPDWRRWPEAVDVLKEDDNNTLSAEALPDFINEARHEILKTMTSEDGIFTPAELQRLVQIERLYDSNGTPHYRSPRSADPQRDAGAVRFGAHEGDRILKAALIFLLGHEFTHPYQEVQVLMPRERGAPRPKYLNTDYNYAILEAIAMRSEHAGRDGLFGNSAAIRLAGSLSLAYRSARAVAEIGMALGKTNSAKAEQFLLQYTGEYPLANRLAQRDIAFRSTDWAGQKTTYWGGHEELEKALMLVASRVGGDEYGQDLETFRKFHPKGGDGARMPMTYLECMGLILDQGYISVNDLPLAVSRTDTAFQLADAGIHPPTHGYKLGDDDLYDALILERDYGLT